MRLTTKEVEEIERVANDLMKQAKHARDPHVAHTMRQSAIALLNIVSPARM